MYTKCSTTETGQRNTFGDGHHLMSSGQMASLLVDIEHLQIVRYPKIEGFHTTKTVAHFVHACEHLNSIHESNYVHGDIREANIVFGSDEKTAAATIIDFDWTRKVGDKYAVQLLEVNDGKRHVNAKADFSMEYEHDWFAFASVMRMYKVKKVDDLVGCHSQDAQLDLKSIGHMSQSQWEDLCSAVETCTSATCNALAEVASLSAHQCLSTTTKLESTHPSLPST
jgi:serine/threonine protein kinase